MSNIFEVEDLKISLPNGRTLLSEFSLTLNQGEILWVRGENGAGKSTLISAILGHFPISKGFIKLNIKKDKVTHLPQTYAHESPIPMNLGDIVTSGLKNWGPETMEGFHELLNPEKDFEKSWNTSSGGEQKRALLFKSLLGRPDLLVLDEPFNHLDEVSIEKISNVLLHGSKRNLFKAAILISHGLPESLKNFENLREVYL